jgi:hypothetical protein
MYSPPLLSSGTGWSEGRLPSARAAFDQARAALRAQQIDRVLIADDLGTQRRTVTAQ